MPTRRTPETPTDDEALELLAKLPQAEQDELAMLAQNGVDLSALAEPVGDDGTGDGQESAQGDQEAAGDDDSADDEAVQARLAEAAEVRTYVARYGILVDGVLLAAGQTFPATAAHPRVLAGQAELYREPEPTEDQQAALDALP